MKRDVKSRDLYETRCKFRPRIGGAKMTARFKDIALKPDVEFSHLFAKQGRCNLHFKRVYLFF